MNRLLDRLKSAIVSLDLGISSSSFNNDLIKSANKALREVGAPPLVDLGNASSLLRAVTQLESEV